LCMHKCLYCHTHMRTYTLYLYFASQLDIIPNLNDYRITVKHE